VKKIFTRCNLPARFANHSLNMNSSIMKRTIALLTVAFNLSAIYAAVEPGFIDLLDTEHSAHWVQCGPGSMTIQNGVTHNSSSDDSVFGVAWYTERTFADFILKAEFQGVANEFNSGVRFRFPNPGQDPKIISEQGYEIAISKANKKDPSPTGSIRNSKKVQKPSREALKARDWNEFEITVVGQQITVRLNGELVNQAVATKALSGYIGLEENAFGPVQFRNVRIKDLSAPGSPMVTTATPQQLTAAPTAPLTLDPNQPLLDTFTQLAPNASAWVLAGLDEGVPPNVRQNLTYIREDLLDEYKQKPKASQDAYKLAHQLCTTMINALDERDQTLVRAGFRAVQADASISGTNQALEVRRNYMMSWPQYAREQAQRAELIRQGTAGAQVGKALPKVEWSTRTAKLRKTLDDLYAQFREALRQSAAVK